MGLNHEEGNDPLITSTCHVLLLLLTVTMQTILYTAQNLLLTVSIDTSRVKLILLGQAVILHFFYHLFVV